MSETVRLVGLTKDYGRHRALDGVDLTIGAGEVFGYLGPNGAGKTTTIRLLMGLLRPTKGRAEVFGLDAWGDSVRVHARTGYLPGEPGLYDRLTGREVVEYFAGLRRDRADLHHAITLAERFDLDLDRRVHDLSKGNRQKLAIVQAFMSEPDLLVLDEPTSGLDPLVQQEFHELVGEVTGRGATVLLSSHMLSEVQHMADRVGIIREGRLVAVERLEDLRAKSLHRVEAHLRGPVTVDAFAALDGVRQLTLSNGVLRCGIPQRSLDALVKTLGRFQVLDMTVTEDDLEEMFLTYYAEGSPDAA
jgi:ABC-2 type transport system ATP-binding protein